MWTVKIEILRKMQFICLEPCYIFEWICTDHRRVIVSSQTHLLYKRSFTWLKLCEDLSWECLHLWNTEIEKIISGYSDMWWGQMNGHHFEEFHTSLCPWIHAFTEDSSRYRNVEVLFHMQPLCVDQWVTVKCEKLSRHRTKPRASLLLPRAVCRCNRRPPTKHVELTNSDSKSNEGSWKTHNGSRRDSTLSANLEEIQFLFEPRKQFDEEYSFNLIKKNYNP